MPFDAAPLVAVSHRDGEPLPAGHPAHRLGVVTEHGAGALTMEVRGGWSAAADRPALTQWLVDFAAFMPIAGSGTWDTEVVASLEITVVNPTVADPVPQLEGLGQDSGELGAALFAGSRRRAGFASAAPGDGPVVLIDIFEVDPAWRGTALTPIMALRALQPFAALGAQSAALCAAPVAEDMSVADRTRIADAIAAMWRRCGFVQIATDNADGLDNITMARPLDWADLQAAIRRLSAADAALRVGAGW